MKSVSPRDCALAFALPLTEERFLSDLRSPEHDYAAFICEDFRVDGVEDEYYWRKVYRRFAVGMSRRCEDVERRGVTVVRDATARDFASLFDRHAVVTIVSHWRFCAVRPEEIVAPRAILEALHDPPNELVAAFRAALPGEPGDSREALAAALNAVIEAGHAAYGNEGRVPLQELKIPAVRLTRPTLERAFAGAIAPGRSVEFADGMKTIAEFVDCIPPPFDGLLDLTVCNSAVLGHEVKALRRCVVAVNRHPTEPFIRMAQYRTAMSMLARRPRPYAEAMTCHA
jgi:hypothetical protein